MNQATPLQVRPRLRTALPAAAPSFGPTRAPATPHQRLGPSRGTRRYRTVNPVTALRVRPRLRAALPATAPHPGPPAPPPRRTGTGTAAPFAEPGGTAR